MIKSKYIYNQTITEYNALVSKNEELDFLNEQILYNDEEYAEVSFLLRGLIIDLEKAKYQNNQPEVDRLTVLVENAKHKQAIVYDRLKHLIAEPVYKCQICKDTGVDASGTRCTCFYKRMSKNAYNFLKVTPTKHIGFGHPDLEAIKQDKPMETEKFSRYAHNFTTNSKSLLLLGQVGTGKTVFASAIAQTVQNKKLNVIFLSACGLGQVLLDYHLANNQEKNIYFDILTTCDLLIIDDLGTEPILKNVTLEYFYAIISERLSLHMPFILTTNLSPDNLFIRYGERLYSRLKSKSVAIIPFNGKDER